MASFLVRVANSACSTAGVLRAISAPAAGRLNTCSSACCTASRRLATESKQDGLDLFGPEAGLTHIDGCTNRGFVINDVHVEGRVLCLRTSFLLLRPGLGRMEASEAALMLATLLKPGPEVIVLGTGVDLRPPPAGYAELLAARRIGLETASTPSGAAIFNILAQEGRHVAGVLEPIEPGHTG